MGKIYAGIKNKIDTIFRYIVIKNNKNFKIQNRNISIISSNCNGGVLAHDLNIGFNSPFVNMWMRPSEYVKMLGNLQYYMGEDLQFIEENGRDYPVGVLRDVRLYFQHYSTESEAYNAWMRRKKRIDYNNLVILFTDRDNCSETDLLEFDKLPYKKKVVFTHKPYSNIKSAYYIKGFENDSEVGVLSDFRNDKIGVRYLDEFDFRKLIDE